ncbi:unnamed protein product [Adineta ricciae]|uniref:Ubiquitin-like domain-containing protein n=2 Tax=Adineta ricciae TaxID=249248 RepID=A0A813RIZ0_ADIRI|nr:unnamed protein product [Adineta ricciae]
MTSNTTSTHCMKLQVQYGSDFYELLLTSKEKKICIEQVLEEIEKRLKVPKCHQILMYKGQRLDQKAKTNLDELYIFNNSKIILTRTPKQLLDEQSSSIQSPKEKKIIDTNKEDNQNVEHSINKQQSVPTKQEMHSHPIGFTPEPNKTYEYYTVPYRTDPTTLLQNMSLSTSTST